MKAHKSVEKLQIRWYVARAASNDRRCALELTWPLLLGIVGFVTILQATWENVLLSTWFGLYNGGTAGVIWCTIAVWLLMLCMIASLAEMASMAPTAGGQVCISSLAKCVLMLTYDSIIGKQR